jgi:hypothetical protein
MFRWRHRKMAANNYIEKLRRLTESLRLPPGSLTHVFVLHDDWCQFLTGGSCDCDPILKVYRYEPSVDDAGWKS